MNAQVFEEPSKSEMRAACEIAIDNAGFSLVANPIKVPLPAEMNLNGSLIGDLQSLDGEDNRTFYVLRATSIDALPKWVANHARASHMLKVGSFYVVVREYSPAFKQSCIAAGAGILRLNDENQFEVVADYDTVVPASVEETLARRVSTMRRSMERKLELKRGEIESKYQRVRLLVAEMDSVAADDYVGRVENEYKVLEDWATDVSGRLDAVGGNTSEATITALAETIQAGAILEGTSD
jgi:hypothetical protein